MYTKFNFVKVYQTQKKWELQYPFAFYLASNRGWLCHFCNKYSKRDEYSRSVGVKLHEHPTETFKCHMESKKHTNRKKEKQEIKNLLNKGRIYKKMIGKKDNNPEMSKRETAI